MKFLSYILGFYEDKGEQGILNDYDYYYMSVRQKTYYTCVAIGFVYLTGFVFYRSHLLSILICFLGFLYPAIKTRDIIKERKRRLNLQFKDLLYSLSCSLSAGKSVEMAFRDVLKDLAIIYPDPETDIILEAEAIVRKIEMNETVESAIADFASRSHLEDVENFSEVFHTCKRTGGNIVDIIRNTSAIISDKIEIKKDIDTILAARKFEQKVLNIMPVLMIILLSASAADYVAPVFNTLAGRAAMTVSAGLLAAAYYISKRIMNIEL